MNITHFNTKIEKYLVSFEDGSTDYPKEEEIDNIEVCCLNQKSQDELGKQSTTKNWLICKTSPKNK